MNVIAMSASTMWVLVTGGAKGALGKLQCLPLPCVP